MATEQQQVAYAPQPVQPIQVVQPPVQQQVQPVYQPVTVAAPHKPYPSFLANQPLMIFIIIGAVFLLVGSIMVNVAPEITNKNYSGVSNDVQQSDMRSQKAMVDYGNVMKGVGVFFIFAFLLLAAIMRSDWSDYIRFGILLLLGLVFFAARFTIP